MRIPGIPDDGDQSRERFSPRLMGTTFITFGGRVVKFDMLAMSSPFTTWMRFALRESNSQILLSPRNISLQLSPLFQVASVGTCFDMHLDGSPSFISGFNDREGIGKSVYLCHEPRAHVPPVPLVPGMGCGWFFNIQYATSREDIEVLGVDERSLFPTRGEVHLLDDSFIDEHERVQPFRY